MEWQVARIRKLVSKCALMSKILESTVKRFIFMLIYLLFLTEFLQ